MFNKVWEPLPTKCLLQGHPQELAINFQESLEVVRCLLCGSSWQLQHLTTSSGIKVGEAIQIECGQQAGATLQPVEGLWLGGPPDSPARIWGRSWVLATPQGACRAKWGPWWEGTSLAVPTKLLKQRSMAIFLASVNTSGPIFNSMLAFLCYSWYSWDIYSHFPMMLPHRMRTLVHIKQTIHRKCDTAGTHTHVYTLTCTASLHLFQSQ